MANEVPAAWHAKICHASLLFGEQELAGADDFSESYQGIRGFQVLLDLDQPAEAERIFQALAEDGIVKIPLQKTFWAAHYGMLIDQFGVPWEINCSVD